jgi:excisionase family DNA binding protein
MKTLQLQLTINFDESAINSLTELLVPVIRKAIGHPHTEYDPKQEARLRASQNALFAGEKLPTDQGILIDSREVAKLLKVSPRKLWKMQDTGEMPPPVRIGRAVRWSYEALKKWVDSGCPKPTLNND